MRDRRIEVVMTMLSSHTEIFAIIADPRRHFEFDGSGMLREAVEGRPISGVGDRFTLKMHRLCDDYLMINYVVEFERDRRIFWEPAPGDASRTEGNDPNKIGIAAGYRWGFELEPLGGNETRVTEVFDPGPIPDDLIRDGGVWINGQNSIAESMKATLAKLRELATKR
ncbi:MAG: hypothetical protein ACP5PJ_08765 [Acidimicrobiales bacterium]